MERRIHFNQLPEELREQLVRNLNKSGPCSPLFEDQLSATMDKWSAALWGGAGLMGLALLALHNYGELFGGLQSPVWILAYAFAAWFMWYGALKLLKSSMIRKNLPFKPGIYLFPLDLIDARDAVLRITPTDAVSRVEIEHSESDEEYSHSVLKLIMVDGSVEPMAVRGRALVYDISTSFETQRAEAQRALATHDTQALERLDPLLSIRQSPQGWDKYSAEPIKVSHGPRAKDLLTPFYYLWAFALVLAIGVAPLLWVGRHYLSDAERLEQAKAAPLTGQLDRAQAMEIYLDGGFRHRQEVLDDLLPKARLEIATHKKTATALRVFLSTNPPAQYKAQADAILHQMYSQALERFKAQANKDNPELIELMTKLLAYMEREGSPPVDVIFMPIPTAEVKAIDDDMAKKFGPDVDPKRIAQDPQRGRSVTPILPALTDKRITHLERAVASRLQRFFLMIAPRDILAINHGPRLLDTSTPPTKGVRFPRPTIIIDYTLLPGTALYSSEDSEVLDVSLMFEFSASIYVPELEQPLVWSTTLDVVEDTTKTDAAFLTSTLSSASTYELAISNGFYRFTNKLLTFFFEPSSIIGKKLESSKRPFE